MESPPDATRSSSDVAHAVKATDIPGASALEMTRSANHAGCNYDDYDGGYANASKFWKD